MNGFNNSYDKEDTSANFEIDKFYDFEKNNDRDSVDTLELLRDSADLSKNEVKAQKKSTKTIALLETEASSASTVLSNKIQNDFNGESNYEHQQLDDDYNDDFNNNNNNDEQNNLSRQSITSNASSFNIETKLYPISLIENSVPKDNKNDYKNLNDDEIETADLAHLEPKLREAWIKMRKLDKILERVCKKERMVKKETINLIEKNRADLHQLRLTSDHKESKQEAENTAHFLALSYFDLDDEIERDEITNLNEDEPMMTPVFKTQVPYNMDDLISNSDNKNAEPSLSSQKSNQDDKSEVKNNNKNISSKNKTTKSEPKVSLNNNSNNNNNKSNKKNQNSEKDFIKRNIQLVQDSGGALAMTEEEKQRLNELMLEMEDQDDKNNKSNNLTIHDGNEENPTYIVEYNPYSVSLADGDGFTPDKSESIRLKEIDSKLDKRNSSRLTNESFSSLMNKGGSISSIPKAKSSMNSNYTIDSESYLGMMNENKQIRLNDEFDENEFGDKFIREARLSREQEYRLKFIDTQLERLKSISESAYEADSEIRSDSTVALITEQQLKVLLEECSNELNEQSQNNSKLEVLKEENDYNDNESEFDSNNDKLSIVPVLPDSMIQSLLEQAKNEGIIITDSESANRTGSPIHSFYEEALEIVNSHRKIFTSNNNNINNEEYQNETSNIIIEQTRRNSISAAVSSSSPLPSVDLLTNDNELRTNKLPPLFNSKTETNNESHLNQDLDFRSSSSLSNISTTSSSMLPKISSRYLPK